MRSSIASRSAMLARDVMTPNPLSISETASIREVAAFLLAKRMSAAPVINEAGRAVGVVSLSDIVRHATADTVTQMDAPVRSIMNDEVLFVRPGTAIDCVIDGLLRCQIKRLFVADENDVLVGVISATDVLRYLNSPATGSAPRQAIQATVRRPAAALPRRPAPFAATPRMKFHVDMAGTR